MIPKQKDIALTFGKYNGVLIADIPNSYLNWLLDQDWFCQKSPQVKDQVVIELAYRDKFNVIID